MKRKVIQLSVKTLVVSLPLEWTEKYNVKKGSEVNMEEKGSSIIVKSKKHESSYLFDAKKKVFDKRYIGNLYTRGYDEVKIKFNDKKVIDEIRKQDLLGYEIIDISDDFCIIKNVATAMEDQFDTMLRKCFLLTKQVGESIRDYFKGEDVDLEKAREMEKENNKVSVFCLRILNKKGYNPSYKTNFLYVIARELEAICDIFKYIIDDILDGKEMKHKDYFYEALEFFSEFYALYYKYDEGRWKKFYNKRKELVKKGREIIDGPLPHHSLNLVVAVNNITGPFKAMNFK